MRVLLVIFFLFFYFLGRTQNVDETKSFLNYFRKTVFTVDTLFYTEDLNDITLPEMRKHLLKDTIWIYKYLGQGKVQPVDSIILSKDEKAYLETKLADQEGKIWGDNMLDKSKLTTRDTTYKKYKFSEYPKDYKPKKIYSFSKPIFIKDASICFFYYQEVTAGRGEGQFCLYEKENDKWKFIQWFYSWGGGGY